MNAEVFLKSFEEPPVCEKEVFRYAGCREITDEIRSLFNSCLKEIKPNLSYKVCYRVLSVKAIGDISDFNVFKVKSENLAFNLKGCSKVVLFAATVGAQTDRLINKYTRISPSKALMFQAIGAERIESLCDVFCSYIEKENKVNLTPRFSPGYGDLPLSVQKDIFNILDCTSELGLTLNESLLMSPSKSVTAFAGIKNK